MERPRQILMPQRQTSVDLLFDIVEQELKCESFYEENLSPICENTDKHRIYQQLLHAADCYNSFGQEKLKTSNQSVSESHMKVESMCDLDSFVSLDSGYVTREDDSLVRQESTTDLSSLVPLDIDYVTEEHGYCRPNHVLHFQDKFLYHSHYQMTPSPSSSSHYDSYENQSSLSHMERSPTKAHVVYDGFMHIEIPCDDFSTVSISPKSEPISHTPCISLHSPCVNTSSQERRESSLNINMNSAKHSRYSQKPFSEFTNSRKRGRSESLNPLASKRSRMKRKEMFEAMETEIHNIQGENDQLHSLFQSLNQAVILAREKISERASIIQTASR